jgi:uncharacterized protein YxjI
VLFSEQKMFKLREDIRVFSDEQKSQEVLAIKARQIIDFSAAYDVVDSTSGEKVGALRRKGLKSILQATNGKCSTPPTTSSACALKTTCNLALLRRLLLGNLLPQNYDMTLGETRVADLKQRFNLIRYEMDIDFSMDAARQLDRRLGVAAAALLAIIEGKQDS